MLQGQAAVVRLPPVFLTDDTKLANEYHILYFGTIFEISSIATRNIFKKNINFAEKPPIHHDDNL